MSQFCNKVVEQEERQKKNTQMSSTPPPCTNFVPRSIVRKNKCKNCGQPLQAHVQEPVEPKPPEEKKSKFFTFSKKVVPKKEDETKSTQNSKMVVTGTPIQKASSQLSVPKVTVQTSNPLTNSKDKAPGK